MSGRLEVAGLTIDLEVVEHPLLGRAQRILRGDQLLTHVSAIDWDHPMEIPAVAAPGALPAGTGGALMNLIAERATQPLRYAGPYPTPALYRSLLRSFRASADEATFARDMMERLSSLRRDPIPVDFTPAPHRRVEHRHGVSELRDGLERTTIDSIVFERDGSPGRLLPTDEGVAAEVWFGDAPYARVALLSADGHLVDGPHPISPISSSVLGKAFPPPLAAALGDLVEELVPAPLSSGAKQLLATRPIVWADLGARAARATADHVEVHAALWEQIAPLGMARLALALAEALAPVVTTTLAGLLQSRTSSRPLP